VVCIELEYRSLEQPLQKFRKMAALPLAAPVIIEGLGAIIAWLGIGAVAVLSIQALIDKSKVSSGMKQYVSTNSKTVESKNCC
jgi:hypothetical protein